ncbi:MAG TPA: DUF3857 domain-containing protein [Bacteroidia bacterium]|nr:DUF3857 domain-containing protein [Bacteroidia bacterium]
MNKRIILIILLVFQFSISFSQLKGLKEYKWPDKPKPNAVYPKFSNEDAYLVNERKTISFSVDSRGIYMYTNIKRKIKILTQKGIDNYAKIVLPKNAGKKLTLIDARTIKGDGKIVDLDIDQIKEIQAVDDENVLSTRKYILFAVPGVEVGDEIEFIAGYGGYGTGLGQEIYLHSYLAAVKREVMIHRMKEIELDIRFYNNLAYPKQSETSTEITFSWESNDLPSLERQPGSVPTLDLPFISYAVKKVKLGGNYYDLDGVGNAWTSALDWFGKYYLIKSIDNNYRDKKLDSFFESLWADSGSTNIVSKVRVVHDYLNKNMEVVDLPESESNLALSSYVTSKKVDESNLYRIYHYLLHRMSTATYFCMARDFYDGPIDVAFVAFQQINELIFAFKDESGTLHYVMPRGPGKQYEVDEVMDDIQGTQCISISLQGNNEVTMPKLPFNMATDNIRSRQAKVNLALGKGNANLQVVETFQGVTSTNARHFYINENENGNLKEEFTKLMKERNDKMILDSINILSFDNQFPFTFKINYGLNVKDAVTEMDAKLFSVSMENWFYHNIDILDSSDRAMDYYFPNLGKDVFKYFLIFENDVKLVNADKLKKYISLPFCNYNLEITQLNSKSILVESAFQVKQIRIPLDEVGKYVRLCEKIEEADNEPIIIQTL